MSDYDRIDPEVLELGLPELLARAVRRWPDRVAVAFPGERLTYRQLWQRALVVGRRLTQAGVRPGEHVGLLIPNSARFLTTLLGISLTGAIPVPLNTRFRSDELPYVIERADLVALIVAGEVEVNPKGETVDYCARLLAALPSLAAGADSPAADAGSPAVDPAGPAPAFCAQAPELRLVAGYGPVRYPWITPWAESGDELPPATGSSPTDSSATESSATESASVASVPEWVAPSTAEGIALMLFTSGTTSRPKAVQNSHRALVLTGVLGMVGRIGMRADDVVWSPAPLCHIGAYVALIGSFATGACFVTAPYFQAHEAIELLAAERVTIAYAGFPAFYLDLAKGLAETDGQLPDLRILTTAAAPGEVERVRAGLPNTLQLSVTGSTELSGSICVSDATDTPAQRANSAGRPLDGIEVSIRDEQGLALPSDVTGEIWVRGYCLLSGYYKDPSPLLTTEPDPGWYRTGDLGALVEGRLSFRGRLKDMIKVGGENVAAAEVENYLLRHPAVALAQVVARPDLRLGEVPVAFLELAPGGQLTESEALEFCRGSMAGYKVPRAVRFVTEWPMSATKISKPALVTLAAQGNNEFVDGKS